MRLPLTSRLFGLNLQSQVTRFVLRLGPREFNRFAAGMILCALGGCATEDILVSEVAITDRPDASVVGWSATESGREVFTPEDEEVTIKVLFNFNYRGVYEWYKVEWIAPGGDPYQVVSRRTDFASHRDLQASMKIRGKMASRLPGLWRVRVSLLGRDGAPNRELASRLFRIAQPSAEMIAAGLTPVDAPEADQQRNRQPTGVLGSVGTKLAAMRRRPSWTKYVEPSPRVQSAADTVVRMSGDKTNKLALQFSTTTLLNASAVATGTSRSASQSRTHAIGPRVRKDTDCPPLYYRPGLGCVEQGSEE